MIDILHQKPLLGRQINRGHPLSVGLIGSFLFNEKTGITIWDSFGTFGTQSIIGTPDWQVTPQEHGLRTDDDQHIDFSNQLTNFITDKFTVVWIGTPVQLTSSFRRFFFGQYDIGAGSDFDWGLYLSAAFNVTFFVVTGGTVSINSTNNLVVGTSAHLVGRYDGANVSIWLNGIKEGEDVQTGNVASNSLFHLGGQWFGAATPCNLITSTLHIYKKALTDDEIEWIFREPYAMFQQNRVRWFSVGAPPAGNVPTGALWGPLGGPMRGVA